MCLPRVHTPQFASIRIRTVTCAPITPHMTNMPVIRRSSRRMNFLLAPFQYDFMQRAFIAALLVGVLCATMGTYVILRRLAFIGDGIAHASFAGIVIAYLRGIDYYFGAAVV